MRYLKAAALVLGGIAGCVLISLGLTWVAFDAIDVVRNSVWAAIGLLAFILTTVVVAHDIS